MPHDEPCRVAVVSPQEVTITGLREMLGRFPDRVRVIDLATGPDAVTPDVVLYDVLGLLESDGGDLVRVLSGSPAAVLAISHDLRPDLAARALALGVDGYFSISVDAGELIDAVASACDGDAETVGSAASDAAELLLGREVGLTRRETEVMVMITQGFSNQEIADKSYLSINSVKTYIRTGYRKMNVTSRSQAVRWCLQHGFPPEPEPSA